MLIRMAPPSRLGVALVLVALVLVALPFVALVLVALVLVAPFFVALPVFFVGVASRVLVLTCAVPLFLGFAPLFLGFAFSFSPVAPILLPPFPALPVFPTFIVRLATRFGMLSSFSSLSS